MKTIIYRRFNLLFLVIIFVLNACAYAQDNDAKIKSIADKACECITKIKFDAGEDNVKEETNKCISKRSSTSQVPTGTKNHGS